MNGCSLYNQLFQNQVIVPVVVNYRIEYVPGLKIVSKSDGEVLPEQSTKENATLHYPERTDQIAFVILFSGVHLSFMITCFFTWRWTDIWGWMSLPHVSFRPVPFRPGTERYIR